MSGLVLQVQCSNYYLIQTSIKLNPKTHSLINIQRNQIAGNINLFLLQIKRKLNEIEQK